MEELKPCPFCGSTNVGISPYDGAKTVVCMDCLCMSAGYRGEKAATNAIAAWNLRAALENKPLTLEQLRQMDGEPVWFDWDNVGWAKVVVIDGHPRIATAVERGNGYECHLYTPTDIYGNSYAYARKPEGSEKE